MKITLQPGEAKIDTWTILYQPPKGEYSTAKFVVRFKTDIVLR